MAQTCSVCNRLFRRNISQIRIRIGSKNAGRKALCTHCAENMIILSHLAAFAEKVCNITQLSWHKSNFWNFITGLAHFDTAFAQIINRFIHAVQTSDYFYTKSHGCILNTWNMKVVFKIYIGKVFSSVLVCKGKGTTKQTDS